MNGWVDPPEHRWLCRPQPQPQPQLQPQPGRHSDMAGAALHPPESRRVRLHEARDGRSAKIQELSPDGRFGGGGGGGGGGGAWDAVIAVIAVIAFTELWAIHEPHRVEKSDAAPAYVRACVGMQWGAGGGGIASSRWGYRAAPFVTRVAFAAEAHTHAREVDGGARGEQRRKAARTAWRYDSWSNQNQNGSRKWE
ncbi:hypothetical protein PLESTM_001352900 [Pleodorina starrii]|nr:hypothetical protein PLESTM_001352900 [Pleodorina starrii]